MSVVNNLGIPTSALKKRHNVICYHMVRGAHAKNILRVGCIPLEFNLEELFKNTTIPGNTRHN